MQPTVPEPKQKTANFQIRWREPLGLPECPYMYRWVLILFGFSIRVHHWLRSDDKRHMHNHPWNFVTIVLKGSYTDVSKAARPDYPDIRETLTAGCIKFRRATHAHYVDVPASGAWTLLITGRKKQNWGFRIKDNQFFRPLRYFSKYGHPPCSEQ